MKATLIGTVVCLGLLAGCGGNRWEDYCAEAMKCEGGNEDDEAACVAELNGVEESAAAYDCSDEFDAIADCVIDNSVCEDFGTTVDYYTTEDVNGDDPCDDEDLDLEDCIEAASSLD